VNLPTHFASMSVDELWEIHEEISKLLKVKMLAETKTLERRLNGLRPYSGDGGSSGSH
jgi:DNA-binding protein H-NS